MTRPAHTAPPPADIERLQESFARRCTARLASSELPHDTAERLRAARERALAVQRSTHPAVVASGGTAAILGGFGNFGSSGHARWLAGALLALAAFALFSWQQQRQRTPAPMSALGLGSASAPIDIALLTDPLPPQAYADPGFIHFLRLGTSPTSKTP